MSMLLSNSTCYINIFWMIIFEPFAKNGFFLNVFQATIMQASVNVSRLATYGPYLWACSMYSFTSFDVTQCNQNFRLSHSSLLIRFSDATTLAELTEPSSPIPKECFRFRNHSEMLGLPNTNTQLPGIPPIICSSI